MKVMISDGSNFITRDNNYNYTLTTDKNKAYVVEEKVASKLIQTSLKRHKLYSQKKWSIIRQDDSVFDSKNIEFQRVLEDKTSEELLNTVELALEACCELMLRKSPLEQQLYDETKEREDLEHTIENLQFNAYQGYSLCKQLQNASRRRRITKKNVQKLRVLMKSSLFEDISAMRDIITQLREIENADTYHYRKLTDFGESIQFGATMNNIGK